MKTFFFVKAAIIVTIFVAGSCDKSDPISGNGGLSDYAQIDYGASWSHDESKILFIRRSNDFKTSGLFILNHSNLSIQMLVNGLMDYPDWSYDTRKVIYTLIGELNMINLTGDTLNVLFPGGLVKSASWKWNPNWIVMTLGQIQSNSFELNLFNPATNDIQPLNETGFQPSWSENGEDIVYLKPIFDNNGLQVGDSLMIFETGPNRKTLVREMNQPVHKISSFPKFHGNKIYFSSTATDGKTFVYSINIDGSNLTKIITTQSISPDISQSGILIYTNREPGNGHLWEMNLNTGVNRQITF
jgi:Tol biopolymer transport system component